MTILPGVNPKDPAQPAATRSMLRALRMGRDEAAAAGGVSLAEMDALCDGKAHTPTWTLLAERLIAGGGPERDQSSPRELFPTPKELRRAGIR